VALRSGGTRLPRALFVLLVFVISIVPAILSYAPLSARLEQAFPELASRYSPLMEMRPLAPWPTGWEGRWFDFDKNYRRFENGFSDHLGLRSLMVRTKNEIDFRLFGSSRRVYFGKQGELYGRSISDIELPATENFLANPASADAVYNGMARLSAQLRAQGTTMVLVTPVSKQYFTQDRIPFFLPRLKMESNFMKLYRRFERTPEFNFVDVYGILKQSQDKFQIFYHNDFHWTDLSAMQVAADVTNRIARMEKSSAVWGHRMEVHEAPFFGSEARFAARLDAVESEPSPQLTKTWQDVHRVTEMNAKQTGYEFITDTVAERGLLPATCMFGNSFGDGMVRAGLADHFEQFVKLDRAVQLQRLPELTKGRCKYLIVQVLDNEAGAWLSLSK
jgi:alginate O-acetyltransferase complex protein AlgJ